MVLNNVLIPGTDGAVNIRLNNGLVETVAPAPMDDSNQITFVDALAFPGLINSHDHLDFNLFPQLGIKIYQNYTQWGNYIHEVYADEIASVLKIPIGLREKWGVYKNLLCGVTTVVNHGEKPVIDNALIDIIDRYQSIHSVQFDKNWKKRLNNPMKMGQPAVIHIGEGTDDIAHNEISELIKWNMLGRKLIGIHGVAMDVKQAKHFKALVWCPESNYYLLNKTAPIDELKKQTTILFGTDSTLTGHWDVWQHIRLARKTALLSGDELYQSLTIAAAKTWKLNKGQIAAGLDADIVVAKAKRKTGLTAFYNITPDDILLVIQGGEIRLFDESLYHQLNNILTARYSKIFTGGHFKYIQGDIHQLMDEIKSYKPNANFPVPQPALPAA
ncbi:amidohydrolase family protein [Mucilaginibacter celer]|uniref:Amidohydrolase-related domain-containing protein n=1 Tax=Mucilaginibacter celer TaxID=2305508 RepID=A0A494VYD0_9SPHI|nr:amidohydrolase family protein [Mucilaginibacter celer]AYL96012.1 hypothetical protein HYN43_012255 [Mucilaginibacter celer]